jgi:chemotaxis receptor (MCP) glutamine deamidase CheD
MRYKKIDRGNQYFIVGPNEVIFITTRQTLSVVLGSCISTVFIGKGDQYVLAANHIVIAIPNEMSVIAKKSARTQINEMIHIYKSEYNISLENLRCLHLVGAGKKLSNESFLVHEKNITDTSAILSSLGIMVLFNDTGSHMNATYSIYNNYLGVFVENMLNASHISFTIDLDGLYSVDLTGSELFPASPLLFNNPGFEFLVGKKVIDDITGDKKRYPVEP